MTGGETEGMRYFMNRLVWIVSIFTMIAVFMSCGKAKEAAVEQAIERQAASQGEKVDVDVSGDKMTIQSEEGTMHVDGDKATYTSKDGTTKIDGNSMEVTSQDGAVHMVTGDKAALPADFPKDVPVYPGAQVTVASTDKSNHTTMITLHTPDALDKVSGYIQTEATSQGWTEDMVIKQPGDQPMHMFEYKKDTRTLVVTAAGASEGTDISLNLEEAPAQEAAPTEEAAAPEEAPEEAPAEAEQPVSQ
jgi:hypothetical protein